MFKSNEFNDIYSKIREFNELIQNYSINSKDKSEDMTISIIYSYENKLKQNFKQLLDCVKDIKEAESKKCIPIFKENFIKLRSDISLQIENLKKNN